jgi:membrane protein
MGLFAACRRIFFDRHVREQLPHMDHSFTRRLRVAFHLLEATWYYVSSIARKLMETDILFLASGLAFNGILTMISLLLLSASALGSFLHSSELGVRQLHDTLDAIFPPQPFATSIKESILNFISDIIAHRRSLGVFGAFVLVWTATSLFDALRSALHRIYLLKRTRGLLMSLLHDIGFVLLAFVLFIASNLAIWVSTFFEGLVRNVPALAPLNLPAWDRTVPTTIVILLTAIMFYIVYRYIPDTKPPKAAGIISTITTTVLWVISGKLFAIYLADFSAIGKIYGPYAFLLVLLFWIYYSSLIFVVGGIVGQVYWERLKLKAEESP